MYICTLLGYPHREDESEREFLGKIGMKKISCTSILCFFGLLLFHGEKAHWFFRGKLYTKNRYFLVYPSRGNWGLTFSCESSPRRLNTRLFTDCSHEKTAKTIFPISLFSYGFFITCSVLFLCFKPPDTKIKICSSEITP